MCDVSRNVPQHNLKQQQYKDDMLIQNRNNIWELYTKHSCISVIIYLFFCPFYCVLKVLLYKKKKLLEGRKDSRCMWSRFKVSTWPFMQPPTKIFGLEGQNSKAKMSSGHSSSNCKQHRKIHSQSIKIRFQSRHLHVLGARQSKHLFILVSNVQLLIHKTKCKQPIPFHRASEEKRPTSSKTV